MSLITKTFTAREPSGPRVGSTERLWDVERFDRIVAPASGDGHEGFTEKELAWILTHAPSETVVLKPTPVAA
jgi:hypothetical protein